MWLDDDVVLQRRQSRKLAHEVCNAISRFGQVLKDQSDCSSTVMSQMNFGNCNSTTAFAAEYPLGFNQSFRDISLAHRSTNNISTVMRCDDVYRTGRRNICD